MINHFNASRLLFRVFDCFSFCTMFMSRLAASAAEFVLVKDIWHHRRRMCVCHLRITMSHCRSLAEMAVRPSLGVAQWQMQCEPLKRVQIAENGERVSTIQAPGGAGCPSNVHFDISLAIATNAKRYNTWQQRARMNGPPLTFSLSLFVRRATCVRVSVCVCLCVDCARRSSMCRLRCGVCLRMHMVAAEKLLALPSNLLCVGVRAPPNTMTH